MTTYGLSKSKYIITPLQYIGRSILGSYLFDGGKVTPAGKTQLNKNNIFTPGYIAVLDIQEKVTEGNYSHIKKIRIRGDQSKVLVCKAHNLGAGFFVFNDDKFSEKAIDGYLNFDLVGEEITLFPGSGHLILSVWDDTNLSLEGEMDVTFENHVNLNNLSFNVKSSVIRAEDLRITDQLSVNMDLSNLQLKFFHTSDLYITATRSSIKLDGHVMYPQIMIDNNSDMTIFNSYTDYPIKIGKAEFEVTQNHIRIEKGKIISLKKKDGE